MCRWKMAGPTTYPKISPIGRQMWLILIFPYNWGLFLAYFGTFATPAFTHFYRYTPKKCFASSKSSNEESSPRNKPHDTLTPFPCHRTPKKGLKSGILQFCPEKEPKWYRIRLKLCGHIGLILF